MKFLTELWNRLSIKSPAFFQVLQTIAIIAGALGGLPLLISEFQGAFPTVVIPNSIVVFSGKVTLISAIVLWVIAKLPIKPEVLAKALADGKLPFTEQKQIESAKK